MIIEFVGCSGAGKTTLVADVVRKLRDGGRTAASSTALIADVTRTAWVSSLFLRNICLDVLLFPWLLLALRHNARFFLFGMSQIIREADSFIGILQRSLSQLRNLAGDQLLRHLAQAPDFILVDEGTICGIHNVLVHLNHRPAEAEIQAYARLVPKPELIVHINTPVEIALSRTESRPDPPLRFHKYADKFHFVRVAHETHVELSRCDEVRTRWFVVSPGDNTTRDTVEAILSRESEGTA